MKLSRSLSSHLTFVIFLIYLILKYIWGRNGNGTDWEWPNGFAISMPTPTMKIHLHPCFNWSGNSRPCPCPRLESDISRVPVTLERSQKSPNLHKCPHLNYNSKLLKFTFSKSHVHSFLGFQDAIPVKIIFMVQSTNFFLKETIFITSIIHLVKI